MRQRISLLLAVLILAGTLSLPTLAAEPGRTTHGRPGPRMGESSRPLLTRRRPRIPGPTRRRPRIPGPTRRGQ